MSKIGIIYFYIPFVIAIGRRPFPTKFFVWSGSPIVTHIFGIRYASRGMQGGTRRGKKRDTKRRIQSKYKSKRYRRCKCKRSRHRRNRMTRRV